MAFYSMFNIAGSGLHAQNERLNIIASNLANADSMASSRDQAYKARQPVFASVYEDVFNQAANPGVSMIAVVESDQVHDKHYAPENPIADADGYVYLSNVDVIAEMTNMIVAGRSYQNNVEVMNTAKELLLATLRIGQ